MDRKTRPCLAAPVIMLNTPPRMVHRATQSFKATTIGVRSSHTASKKSESPNELRLRSLDLITRSGRNHLRGGQRYCPYLDAPAIALLTCLHTLTSLCNTSNMQLLMMMRLPYTHSPERCV